VQVHGGDVHESHICQTSTTGTDHLSSLFPQHQVRLPILPLPKTNTSLSLDTPPSLLKALPVKCRDHALFTAARIFVDRHYRSSLQYSRHKAQYFTHYEIRTSPDCHLASKSLYVSDQPIFHQSNSKTIQIYYPLTIHSQTG